ncbi:MAG TPA: hypothetical protein VEH79_02650 [Gaiellaceae bacterium]|nr:hypothetical protein [Gaiellaceae bacterium]
MPPPFLFELLLPPAFELLFPPAFELLFPPAFELLLPPALLDPLPFPPAFELLLPPGFELMLPPGLELLSLPVLSRLAASNPVVLLLSADVVVVPPVLLAPIPPVPLLAPVLCGVPPPLPLALLASPFVPPCELTVAVLEADCTAGVSPDDVTASADAIGAATGSTATMRLAACARLPKAGTRSPLTTLTEGRPVGLLAATRSPVVGTIGTVTAGA